MGGEGDPWPGRASQGLPQRFRPGSAAGALRALRGHPTGAEGLLVRRSLCTCDLLDRHDASDPILRLLASDPLHRRAGPGLGRHDLFLHPDQRRMDHVPHGRDSLPRGLLSHRAGRALHRGHQLGLRLHPPSNESGPGCVEGRGRPGAADADWADHSALRGVPTGQRLAGAGRGPGEWRAALQPGGLLRKPRVASLGLSNGQLFGGAPKGQVAIGEGTKIP
mmetsp:Transcript_32096/g.51648  ORF Transcript_32096/g.51648 Transcript_32096/m.51648 type:complete len:221 (-) Transcript_32096:1310-1972(-)